MEIASLFKNFERVKNYLKLILAREVDQFRYWHRLKPLTDKTIDSEIKNACLMIVSGRGMNVMFAQIWTFIALFVKRQGFRVCAISRRRSFLNRYYKLVGIEIIYLDSLINNSEISLPTALTDGLAKCTEFQDMRSLYIDSMPIGEIVMSTICRNRGVGRIDAFDPVVRLEASYWLEIVYKSYALIQQVIDKMSVTHSFHTEVFMQEYGGIYYGSLKKDVNVIRFTPTIRDDALIVQKLTSENSRLHHSSLDKSTWDQLKEKSFTSQMEFAMQENFRERYSEKWHRAKRNYIPGSLTAASDVRNRLGIGSDKPLAVIFSHILYDTIYFFGTDLYEDYTTWLIETVRIAIKNTNVHWLVKLHPSNIWRGEVDTLLKGQTLEETLLMRHFGELPSHVTLLHPDVSIGPLALMKSADFGVTVRGTSGLEMAALGKTVVTCGTGRYEGNGFTIDPTTISQYESHLKSLHEVRRMNEDQMILAKKYAYGIFVLKPFIFDSLCPELSFGKKVVKASDDLSYLPRRGCSLDAGTDVTNLLEFLNSRSRDLLTTSDSF